MATLRCKSCGRIYNYEKNGTCPKCGAYNRPPRKEIVDADGSIRYVTTEKKVCYEEEECYEDEVRQSANSYNYTSQDPIGKKKRDKRAEINDAANRLRQARNNLSANDRKKLVTAVAAVVTIISLVMSLADHVVETHEPTVEPPWESVEAVRKIRNLNAHVESVIPTENGSVTINSCRAKGDVLHIDLQCGDIDNISVSGYYETLTDSGYLEMVEAYSSGDLHTYLASLPEEIDAADCAVVLDIPYEAGVNRYFIWVEQPAYEMGEAFTYCGQRVCVDSWEQVNNEVKVWLRAEDETPAYSEAHLTALNAADQPYTVHYYGYQHGTAPFTDSKLFFDFTLRNENDTIQSIMFCDTAGNHRQVTVNLQ